MLKSPNPTQDAEFATLSKPELRELADSLLASNSEPWKIERCIAFVLADTGGLWHGRARAMMCRRLKHCSITQPQQKQLITTICERLERGKFSEQFKDQLRLALHLERTFTLMTCEKLLSSELPYVRRYAAWALSSKHTQNNANE